MQTSELTRDTSISGSGSTDDNSRLILSSPKEKIMERVKALKKQALATKNREKAEKYKSDYGCSRNFLASRWFLIDFHLLTNKDDQSALELLVCRKAKKHTSVYLVVNLACLGATQYLALISPDAFLDTSIYLISFIFMFFGNGIYGEYFKGWSGIKFLLNRWRLKRLGLLSTGC